MHNIPPPVPVMTLSWWQYCSHGVGSMIGMRPPPTVVVESYRPVDMEHYARPNPKAPIVPASLAPGVERPYPRLARAGAVASDVTIELALEAGSEVSSEAVLEGTLELLGGAVEVFGSMAEVIGGILSIFG